MKSSRIKASVMGVLALFALSAFADEERDWSALQAAPWQRAGWLALVIGAGAAAYFTALALLGFRPRDFRHRA